MQRVRKLVRTLGNVEKKNDRKNKILNEDSVSNGNVNERLAEEMMSVRSASWDLKRMWLKVKELKKKEEMFSMTMKDLISRKSNSVGPKDFIADRMIKSVEIEYIELLRNVSCRASSCATVEMTVPRFETEGSER